MLIHSPSLSAVPGALHYLIDPELGWMYARTQTRFPFRIHISTSRERNGWPGVSIRKAYVRQDNCCPGIEDYARAQQFSRRPGENQLGKQTDAFRTAPQPTAR